jgi:hypothetical protein
VVINENGACFENRIGLETACHAEGPGGQGSEKAGSQGPENRQTATRPWVASGQIGQGASGLLEG